MAQLIDDEALLERVDGDAELLERLVSMFVVDTPPRLAAIRTGLGAGDAHAVERAAHGLKGALAIMAAEQAAAVAYRIEQLGRAGTLTEAPAILSRLEEQVRAATEALQALVRHVKG